MIAAVVFDFGGVVVEWNMRALFREFLEGDELDRFLADVLTPADNLRCDLGTPLAQVVDEVTARHPHYEVPLAAWRDRWIETIPGPIPGTERLIGDLRTAGYRILGLSNFSAETFPLCRERYPVFEQFDDIVISGEAGVAKPDPRIYQLLLDRNSLRPDQAVFLDDSPTNVNGAIAVGMAAFGFTTAEQAAVDLRSVGVELLPGSATAR